MTRREPTDGPGAGDTFFVYDPDRDRGEHWMPFATIVIGLVKSNRSGEMSSVKPSTPRVTAVTVLPLRVRSTRPDGRVRSNTSRGGGVTIRGS